MLDSRFTLLLLNQNRLEKLFKKNSWKIPCVGNISFFVASLLLVEKDEYQLWIGGIDYKNVAQVKLIQR